MMEKTLRCDGGCGRWMSWEAKPGLTKAAVEQLARDRGWHAPDKLGRHFCLSCRTPAGAIQWWRKENVRRGLDAGYGLGACTCAKYGPGRKLDDDCVSAGHPGVDRRL